MKRARFTKDKIIGVPKEREAGAKTWPCQEVQISEATLYNWKIKYGGTEVFGAKRLKALEDKNAKLKKLAAEQMLDATVLRELLAEKISRTRRQARGGRASQGHARPVGAAGLQHSFGRPDDDPLPLSRAGGYGAPAPSGKHRRNPIKVPRPNPVSLVPAVFR